MAIEIKMPALSPTMTEGRLSRWLVGTGDKVASGDVIAEIETDKATMEVEAIDEGTFGAIHVQEGTDGVAVGEVIATCLKRAKQKCLPRLRQLLLARWQSKPPLRRQQKPQQKLYQSLYLQACQPL